VLGGVRERGLLAAALLLSLLLRKVFNENR